MKDKINLGIIGMGTRARSFCDIYPAHPAVNLQWVCDLDPSRFDVARARLGRDDLRCFTDLDQMLADPDLDAVVIATYDHQHVEPTVKALAAGKHCLLEKPVAQTVEDCQTIMRAAEKSDANLMIGLELRHCVLFEAMRKLIDEGAIGTPKIGHALDNVSVGGAYYFHDQTRRKEYIQSLLIQKACHSLDLLNWFMGARPKEVFAYEGLDAFGGNEPDDKRCRDCAKKDTCPEFAEPVLELDYGESTRREDLCAFAECVDTPDNSELLVRYDNGARATFIECHFSPEYSREFWIIGDEGKMYGYYDNPGRFLIRVHRRHEDTVREYRPVSTGGHHGGGDLRIRDEWIDCIRSGRTPRVDLDAGYDSTVMAIRAMESAENGRPMAIPDWRG